MDINSDDAPNDSPVHSAISWDIFRCPETGERLHRHENELVSENGRRCWPIVRGIPRFVGSDLYTGSFSFEWITHNRTQLDSHTGSTSSEEVLIAKTGLSREQVIGKMVLDAGVGAGRFTDILSRWGANVAAVDLSFAVESAWENFQNRGNVIVAQADIGSLPFADATFDSIISIGVLHHTPDTRAYFEKLVRLLKPGGEICIWVYPTHGDYLKRAQWIPFTSRIPARWFYGWCRCFVPMALRRLDRKWVQVIARFFPFSNQGLGLENDILDTFDGYSPRYHWLHNPAEVEEWFRAAGLVEVRTLGWDTAVRGRRPPLK